MSSKKSKKNSKSSDEDSGGKEMEAEPTAPAAALPKMKSLAAFGFSGAKQGDQKQDSSKADKPKTMDGAEKVTKDKSSLPWVEKYRPASLSELISHRDIISTINRFIDEKRLPHLLFYGPPGTGKTSTILAIARKIYGPHYQSMILELNASDDRGIDVVREQIKEFASTRKIFQDGPKLIVLDEADAMTHAAQAALRRVIEKYSKNARFCIICNYISKLIPALQSRCTRFRFAPLTAEQAKPRLELVIQQENIKCTPDGLTAVLALGGGDMRKYLNIMQSCSMAFPVINEENVYLCTGNPLPGDIRTILEAALNTPIAEAFATIQALKSSKGLALQDILRETHLYVLRMKLMNEHKSYLCAQLADIEHNLSTGGSEKLQLLGFISAFTHIRSIA